MKLFKVCFIVLEAILFAVFMIMDICDIRSDITNCLKFAGIALCVIYSLVAAIIHSTIDRRLVFAAMFFTLISDVFLLFTDIMYAGVGVFGIVQTIYLIWLLKLKNRMPRIGELEDRSIRGRSILKSFIRTIAVRLSIAAIALIVMVILSLRDRFLIVIVAFYAVSFVDNIRLTICMFITRRHKTGDVHFGLFTLGILLFALCDINVCLVNLARIYVQFMDVFSGVYKISVLAMWFFYLPSQVIITLSAEKLSKQSAG